MYATISWKQPPKSFFNPCFPTFNASPIRYGEFQKDWWNGLWSRHNKKHQKCPSRIFTWNSGWGEKRGCTRGGVGLKRFWFIYWKRLSRRIKIFIQTVASGVDFLGWVHFPDHQVLRTTTKKRMFRNIKARDGKEETVQSYLGLMSHGNSWKLRQKIIDKASKLKSSN